MSWWTSENVEPKRKSRFIVEIANGFFLPNVKTCSKPSANVDIKEFQLINHKFKYPGVVTWQDIKITMVDMNGNSTQTSKFDIDKKGNSIQSKIIKGQSLDTGLLLWRMLKHTGYNLPTEAVGPIAALGPNRQLSTPEKASSIANGFGRGLYGKADFGPAGVGQSSNAQSVRIYTLDPEGNTVETWTLHNPQIKSVNWGDHAYDSDEFVEYSLDISYDFAHLEKGRKVTVSNGLYSSPDINTPVSIGTKYNEFISLLQSGKAFEEQVSEFNQFNEVIQDRFIDLGPGYVGTGESDFYQYEFGTGQSLPVGFENNQYYQSYIEQNQTFLKSVGEQRIEKSKKQLEEEKPEGTLVDDFSNIF